MNPRLALTLALASSAAPALAAPWIDAGDLRMRHSLQQLGDRGYIQAPLTTWPIMWVDAQPSERLSLQKEETGLDQSWAYVRFESKQQAQLGFRGSIEFNGASGPLIFRGFNGLPREQGEISKNTEWTGDYLAFRLSPSYAFDPQDDKSVRFDDSFAALTLGNWVMGAGAIDRWWGPGWHSSLILSTNARPVPGVWFNRKQALPFESRWLSWIGPWTFTAFGGQLETDRHVPETKLLGARLSFKPTQRLEIGLSRTAQWGGEGRSESLSSLVKLMGGMSDNADTEEERENEPGNQLAGVDFRWVPDVAGANFGVYGQFIGEDEAGGLPSRRINMLGVDWTSAWSQASQRWYLEITDTVVGELEGDVRHNLAYTHGTYKTGYHYRGRNLATTWEEDSRVITLGGLNFMASGREFGLSASYAQLNHGGTSPIAVPEGTKVQYYVPAEEQNLAILDGYYRFVLFGGRTTLWAQWMNKDLTTLTDELSSYSLGASWQYRF